MKKITIKRRRRITKHGKGTTNPSKSSRRINPRKHKTRRQSAGGLVFGWESFIDAEKNITSEGGKGIDVKVKLENGKPTWWLIGGNDKTFRELGNGAKDRRYVDFIDALKLFIPLWELNFTNPGRDNDSSKGIKLSHDQFCRLFIVGPLDYPELRKRFRERRYTCVGASGAPASGVAGRAQSQQQQTFGAAPRTALRVAPSSAAVRVAPPPPFTVFSDTSFITPLMPPQPPGPSTKVTQLTDMGFNEADAKKALESAGGIIENAVAILSSAAAGPFTGQQRARGGVVSHGFSSVHATIDDFLNAQNGTFPPQLGGGSCPTYDQALSEIKQGQKKTHWIWYIIPSSPGTSDTSKFFGIDKNAIVTPEQYLSDPTLSARYVQMLTAIGVKLQGFMTKSHNYHDVKQFLVNLMGSTIDYEKLKNSLTIFSNALKTQGKVTPEIALLEKHLGVQLYTPPPGPPPPTVPTVVQFNPPPGPSTSTSQPLTLTPQSPSPFIPPCDEYINFERQISDTVEQPDKILKKMYNITVNDDTSLGISFKWAEASQKCNDFYATSFLDYATNIKKQNYEDLVMKSLTMVDTAINQSNIKTKKVADDGWCFYSAVLTAAQRNPNDVRKFAQAITYCVTHIFTNTENVMKQQLSTLVNGIQSRITVAQLVKLISIPNLTAKQNPCVYPELDQCIGQAAAYILDKNIIVYDENGDVVGKYSGTDSTAPNDQIVLVNTNRNHFDIITSH